MTINQKINQQSYLFQTGNDDVKEQVIAELKKQADYADKILGMDLNQYYKALFAQLRSDLQGKIDQMVKGYKRRVVAAEGKTP